MARQVYADSYTLSGCNDGEYCGVFHRVDATLCDGVPAFQRVGGGVVLYHESSPSGSLWSVGARLPSGEYCGSQHRYYNSKFNPQPSLLPPDAAGYGWSDPGGYDEGRRGGTGPIHIVVGGGGGGGR